MIHEKKVKDPETGESKTEYTTDLKGCKIVMVDGKPTEKKMDHMEKQHRKEGQVKGKVKQRGIPKHTQKLLSQAKKRKEMGRDIEERIGEYVDRLVAETDLGTKLTKKQGSVLDRINSFLKEKEEDEEDEDLDDVEINTDPDAIDKLPPEEKAKVLELKKKIEANADQLSLDDEGDEDEGDEVEPTDDEEEVDVDDVEDSEGDDEPDETGDETEEEPTDDEGDEDEGDEVEPTDDEDEGDDEGGEEEPAPEEEPEDGNLNEPEGGEEEEDEDELEADNEYAKLTKDAEYDVDTNNAYEYYDFLLSKLDDEAMITKLNSAYIKIPKEKRKLTPGRDLLGNVNGIVDSEESGGGDDAFGGEMGGEEGEF